MTDWQTKSPVLKMAVQRVEASELVWRSPGTSGSTPHGPGSYEEKNQYSLEPSVCSFQVLL